MPAFALSRPAAVSLSAELSATGDTVTDGPPSWVSSISTTQWTEISASPVFNTAIDALTPAHENAQYRPGRAAAISAIRDAYCDWEFDPVEKKFHIFGGGHFDGSNNGVFSFDASTLTYSMPVSPTLVYPDESGSGYPNANSTPTYPSGYQPPWGFGDAATITANSTDTTADLPYAADKNAPTSSHVYGCLHYYNGRLRRYYSENVAANLSTGLWEDLGVDAIGPQIPDAGDTWQPGSGYNTNPLGAGTHVAVDTDGLSVWCTLIGAKIGIDPWRAGLLKINRATNTVERLINIGAEFDGDATIVVSGDYVYLLKIDGDSLSPTYLSLTTSWRVHRTTFAVETLTFSGSIPTTDASDFLLPAYSVSSAPRVWAYRTDADALYDINPTPASGAGTSGSPYVLSVTRTALTASSIPVPEETYRLHYVADWGVLMVHPKASAKWWALRTA